MSDRFDEERSEHTRRRTRGFTLLVCAMWIPLFFVADPVTIPRPAAAAFRLSTALLLLGLRHWLRRPRPRRVLEPAITLAFCAVFVGFGLVTVYCLPDSVLPLLFSVVFGAIAITAGLSLSWLWTTVMFVVADLVMLAAALGRELAGNGQVGQPYYFLLGSSVAIYALFVFNTLTRDRGLRAEFDARAQLRLANEQLTHEQDVRSRLFVNLSHDFRTPLAVVRAEGELLRQRFAQLPEVQEAVARIDRNAAAIVDLIEQLLELARLDASKVPLSLTRSELLALARDVTAQLQPANVSVVLTVQAERSACHALVDAHHVRRILQNLVGNAVRQVAPTGGHVRVLVHEDESGPMVDVVDDGPGIAPEARARLFERFASFRPEGSTVSGIGLALARELAQLNGGSLEFLGERAETTFRLRLQAAPTDTPEPARPVDVAVQSAALPTPREPLERSVALVSPASAVATGTPKPWVLVVEDNPDLRASLERLLSPQLEVSAVGSASAALALLSVRAPSIMVCDIMLPDGDGYALLAFVRERRRFEHVPFLLVSALSEPSERVRGLSAGADDYIVKPFSGEELRSRVLSALDRAQDRARTLERQREDLQMELHDGVCGHLSRALLTMEASGMARRDPALASAMESVREGIVEARGLLSALAPKPLAFAALVDQLRWELTCAGDAGGLRVEVASHGCADPRALVSAGAVHTFRRIAHEALTNTIKHADARTLRVELSAEAGLLRLRAVDDGKGRRTDTSSGHGLGIAQRRAARLGGHVTFSDHPEGGFVVDAVLPEALLSPVTEPARSALPAQTPA